MIDAMVLVTIYKDLFAVGNDKILKQFPFINIYSRTLRHKVKISRYYLYLWALDNIRVGDVFEWSRSMRKVRLGSKINDANLMIDSSDFPMLGKSSTSRKSSDWSFKCNSPAQRYMAVMDGKGVVKKLWGGYSPKVSDNEFLKLKNEIFIEKYENAVFVADHGFSCGNQLFSNIKFHVKYVERTNKRGRNGARLSTLTQAQKVYNDQIYSARARVESPFAFVERKFNCAKLFREEKIQQDYFLFYSIAKNNLLKKK